MPESSPNTSPPFEFIDRAEQLEPLLATLDGVEELAMDTEADNLFRYRTRVCLLQIYAGGRIFLVDLLAPLPLERLWSRLRGRLLIMHGSDYDLRLLVEHAGFVPRRIFDTMLAGQLLNLPRIGLAPLLQHHFGVHLSKESQKANWSRRPLPAKMLAYAAMDVFHLPALRDILRDGLVKAGRLGWLEQKCAWQIEVAQAGFPPPDDNQWRIGRSEHLGPRGLAVLHALWHWREDAAEKLDVPPFKVVMNELLLRLAHAADGGAGGAALEGLNLGKRQRLLPGLRNAYLQGLARDPSTLPRRKMAARRRQPLTAGELARQEVLREARDRAARSFDIDPTLIASRSQLVQLARDPGWIDDLLLPWQADLLRPVIDPPAVTPDLPGLNLR